VKERGGRGWDWAAPLPCPPNAEFLDRPMHYTQIANQRALRTDYRTITKRSGTPEIVSLMTMIFNELEARVFTGAH